MTFNSIEELMATVEERRKDILTLEVDLGSTFSEEHEQAKRDLQQAKAMKTVVGGGFLGGDNIVQLEERVASTKPAAKAVWIQYKKLDLGEWSMLVKQTGLTPIDQYEKVLIKTFVAVYGQDPIQPDDWDETEEWVPPTPLSTDAALLSSKGTKGILPGGALHSVVQNFMAWQNSGGDVTIRPTRSGRA